MYFSCGRFFEFHGDSGGWGGVGVGGGGGGLKRSYCIKLEIQWLERLALILVSQMINMFIARSLVNWC